MTEQSWWTRDSEGKEHPDDAALLAFAREKLSGEDERKVYAHLIECPQCWDYCRGGRLLYRMQPMYEPRASVVDEVFTHINNPADAWFAKQRRRLRQLPGDMELGLALVRYWAVQYAHAFLSTHKSKEAGTTRRASGRSMKKLVLIYGLALLLIALMVTFALAFKGKGRQSVFPSNSYIRKVPPQTTVSIPPQPTDTPTPMPTRAAPNPVVATIRLCGTTTSFSQERVNICGNHFHQGDKLELMILYMGRGPAQPYRALIVNAQGQFQTFLIITQCREAIAAVYVKDFTNRSVNPAALTNIRVGRCIAPSGG